MTHAEKISRFESLLAERDIQRQHGAPWLWRRLWARGVELPPPYFLPFAASAGIVLALAAPLGGLLTIAWSYTLGADNPPWVHATVAGGVAAFAIAQALYAATAWRRESNALGLPSWDDFPTEEPTRG